MGIAETLRSVGEIFDRALKKKSEDALARLEMEMHGEGCGCRNCVTGAVAEVNKWVRFVAKDDPDLVDEYSFGVEDENGKLVIKRSRSWEKRGKF